MKNDEIQQAELNKSEDTAHLIAVVKVRYYILCVKDYVYVQNV